MFTIEQIRQAHAKVKSGADFPDYIRELKTLGVKSYAHDVADGKANYFGTNSFNVSGSSKYPAIEIAQSVSRADLDRAIKTHQAGGTDYPTLCKQAAAFGVEKWIVDLDKMSCTYYDRSGKEILSEKIPG